MRKITSLVGILGCLVGGGVLILPSASFAATTVTTQTNTVTLGIENYLALTLVNGAAGDSSVTYNDGTYTTSLDAGSTKANLGTSTFRVTCNYIGSGSDSCSTYGWKVTAASGTEATVNGTNYATMSSANNSATNPAIIYSKASTLSSSESNWMMRVSGISNSTYSSDANYSAPAAQNNFGSLNNIPPTSIPKVIVSGNTFQTINSVANTYIGDEQFTVTYGVSAGAATPADTYFGTITYTLSINSAS